MRWVEHPLVLITWLCVVEVVPRAEKNRLMLLVLSVGDGGPHQWGLHAVAREKHPNCLIDGCSAR